MQPVRYQRTTTGGQSDREFEHRHRYVGGDANENNVGFQHSS